MSQNVVQPSFAAGELSEALYGRVDYAKYRIGAAKMRNFFVDYRGGTSTRTGTAFIGKAQNSAQKVRLIPFQFSSEIAYVLEFGHNYMRVIRGGAYVLETVKVIGGALRQSWITVSLLNHGYTSQDDVYFNQMVGMTELNKRTLRVSFIDVNSFHLLNEINQELNSTNFGVFVSGTVAKLYNLTTPYTGDSLSDLRFIQSGDIVTLTHPDYAPMELSRFGDNNWTLTKITFASKLKAPALVDATATDNTGFQIYSYRVTALTSDGDESNPSVAAGAISINIAALGGSIKITWHTVQSAEYYYVYKAQNFYDATRGNARMPPGVPYGFMALTYGNEINDGNILPDFSLQPPQHRNPFEPGAITDYTIHNPGGGYSYDGGTHAVITDATGSDAVLLPVITDGGIQGFVIENGGHDYTAPTIQIVRNVGLNGTGFTASLTVGPLTGTYPSCCCYQQQRLMFAGTTNRPQTLWGSKPGAFHNFDVGNHVNDGDALNITLASQQVNRIRSMVPMPGGLVIFTSGGVWQVSAGQGNVDAPITPLSVVATPQSYVGASTVAPIPINYNILYIQDSGAKVRELRYQFSYSIYVTSDISVLSSHLFDGHQIVEWAYAPDPFKIIWGVRDDGALLSLTYLPEQELTGWAQHDTYGEYESVCVIEENGASSVYVVVRRNVSGGNFRYIEKFASRTFLYGAEDAWCVDCGLDLRQFEGAATLSINSATGLANVFADASVFVPGNVGRILRAGGGIGTITSYISATHIQVTWYQNMKYVTVDQNGGRPKDVLAGDWNIGVPVDVITNLWHLEGLEVSILGDGNVFPPQVVENGQITLPHEVTKLVVGLGFQAQLQTLKLDVGEPTIQGKRKKLAAATMRVLNTRGLKVGPSFNQLTAIKERKDQNIGAPVQLITDDERLVLTPAYTVPGQIAVQQDYPLPATVLAIIPEIILGDTP